MSIEVTTWDEISQADYDAARALLTQIVSERHPEIDTRQGTISDLVMTLHGVLGGAGRVERARLLAANTLQSIADNPLNADQTVVDALFGNYNVTRRSGSTASGQITIVLSKAAATVVPAGFTFTSGSRTFATQTSFAARVNSGDVLGPTDRVLTTQKDGTYTFDVDVLATAVGSAGILRQGDVVALGRPLPNVLQAYVTQDFVGGQDPETTADLYARLELGISAQTWSNATNVAALVRAQAGFEDAIVSVVGAGQPEMLRDKHSLFPLAYGNRVDAWVKLPTPPSVLSITKTATYLRTEADGPIWRIQLTREDVPGAYFVRTVLRDGRNASAEVQPATQTRAYAASTNDPDIATALEAAFSPFQGLTLEFADAAEPTDVLTPDSTTAEYVVTCQYTPDLQTLQDLMTAPAIRPPAGDLVIRGAVPCLVSIELDFDVINSDLDQAATAAALAQYVNKTGFESALYSSRVAAIVGSFLPDGMNLQRLRLSGIILGPDGSRKLYRSRESLRAPDAPASMITPSTVAFYLDPADVSFNVLT